MQEQQKRISQEENKRTSLKLSKKIKASGFVGNGIKGHRWCWCRDEDGEFLGRLNDAGHLPSRDMKEPFFICTSFDILNDLCITHAKELFGEELIEGHYSVPIESYILHAELILYSLQQNKKEEAEKYLWENTILNKLAK